MHRVLLVPLGLPLRPCRCTQLGGHSHLEHGGGPAGTPGTPKTDSFAHCQEEKEAKGLPHCCQLWPFLQAQGTMILSLS